MVTEGVAGANDIAGARVRERDIGWADLMRAANGGDVIAYRRLLRAIAASLRPWVRSGLTRAGRSAADMEDVVQEVLLAVHLKRHTWDDRQPLGPWVRAIARHKLIDALRRRGAERDLPIEDFSETLPAKEAKSISQSDIDRHLRRLPAGQREVVRAISVHGHSIAEVADRLKMTQGAVRVALHRGLRTLAETFKEAD